MSDDMIIINGLHKYFDRVQAVRGVDLRIRRGEVVVIVGPSGSGKSTVLRCVNHLEMPTRGAVTIDGIDLEAKGTD
ncbi:MAG: amino acid ABC transporter ATP-binding protein, partial [Anaerolineales bacterium]|nr:amino acid ABC transporter ATP-binding protein [Anaerolineales bacterium]